MTNNALLNVYDFDAAITYESPCNSEQLPNGAIKLRLHTDDAAYSALTWMPQFVQYESGLVSVARVKAITAPHDMDSGILLVMAADPRFGETALHLVPSAASPVEGEVAAVRGLVGQIIEPSLRRFVELALSNVDAFQFFWTCPASLNHHHCRAGGLVVHSRHVAEQAAAAVGDDRVQRDFAIAYGLLHDYGKIWAYQNGQLTELASRLGHEQIGYEKLLPALQKLRNKWPDGGVTMQSLLSGEWKRNGTRPIQAVGSVVRALDQYSAESDMTRKQTPKQRWRPMLVK